MNLHDTSSDIKPNASVKYPIEFKGKSLVLPIPSIPDISFGKILDSRKSRYDFRTLSLTKLGELFYFSSRTKAQDFNQHGQLIEFRNVASPGALHSIHSLVRSPKTGEWFHYNSQRHSFTTCRINVNERFSEACFSMVESSNSAWIIWYVCDYDFLASKYTNPLPLAYRDCGGLACTQHLIAEALDLNFTQLGLSGSEFSIEISNERKLTGVGTALIGGRAS